MKSEINRKPRGEQRFAAITYSLVARWTGVKLSTVRAYGARRWFNPHDMEATLEWVYERCKLAHRPVPGEHFLSQQDQLSRQLGFWCYKDYLRSDLWESIRERVTGPCYRCGGEANQVHHKRYTLENMRGDTLNGLARVCEVCHFKSHHAGREEFSEDFSESSPENSEEGDS